MYNLPQRPRWNRKSQAIRNLTQENWVTTNDLILPLFLTEGKNKKSEIASMPNIYRYSSDLLLKEIESCLKLGLTTFCLFPSISNKLKDKKASEGLNKNGLYPSAIKEINKK